jgi:hypothetical protein
MSDQMILHFLQKGIRDNMKANVTRLMPTEKDPTPETFLKFAKFTPPNQPYMMTSAINSSLTIKPSTFRSSTLRQNPLFRCATNASPSSNNRPPPLLNHSSQSRFINHQTYSPIRSQPSHLLPCLVCQGG